jgi:hypothetical protein
MSESPPSGSAEVRSLDAANKVGGALYFLIGESTEIFRGLEGRYPIRRKYGGKSRKLGGGFKVPLEE